MSMSTGAPTRQQPFLFVHSTGPTHVHLRDKTTTTKIHRHVMLDIGKKRRKPPSNPQFDAVIHLPEPPKRRKPTKQPQQPQSQDLDDVDAPSASVTSYQSWSPSSYYETFLALVPPFWEQHPLLTLESQWEDDMFSAYGMILLLHAGSNLADPNYLTKGFWFPFAFQSSRFLHQFQHVFTSPNILSGVSKALSSKFKLMALERSSTTISCIESYLAKPHLAQEAANIVIRAVVAIICYNFISSDFNQALVHLRGLELLITFRGGIHQLQGRNELRLMIFWIDITAALLYGLRPRFPPPLDLIPPIYPSAYPHTQLVTLSSVIEPKDTMDTHDLHLASCITELNAVAALINADLALKGDALWADAVYIELRTNPIAHRLLSCSTEPGVISQDGNFETLRLGAILWIICIKRRCGSFPGSPTAYVSTLLDLLYVQPVEEDALGAFDGLVIRSWLLIICGISACDPAQQNSSADLIASEIRTRGWDWDRLMMSVQEMPWISEFDNPSHPFCLEDLARRLVRDSRCFRTRGQSADCRRMWESRSKIYLEKDDSYLPEIWAWYGIGVFFILLRFAVRLRTVGIRGLHGDDYLNIPYLILYTVNAWIVQVTYHTGANIDITADVVPTLLDEDIQRLELGSKLEFLSWYTYPGLIWVLKFTVLFFYRRITFGGILRRRTLRSLFWMCGMSYIILCLTVTFSCRPYSDNWRVNPLPGPNCTFRPQNFWTLVWLNVVTDAALLAIPVPILWHLRVSLRRKIGIGLLLSSGVFVISTAIVRAVTTLGGSPSVININRWGFRETAVGLISVTLPILSPLLTPEFWRRGPYRRDHHRRLSCSDNPKHNARFGNWLGTVVLRYIDEEEGQPLGNPESARYLQDLGYNKEYSERASSSRGQEAPIYELDSYPSV
ncbi:hypothetical protein HJFPF1_08478 [Paramyrothecium foliicola]|nr:hypothetical protein HJFPF1_08478 [Paramyrothecium foliicola]